MIVYFHNEIYQEIFLNNEKMEKKGIFPKVLISFVKLDIAYVGWKVQKFRELIAHVPQENTSIYIDRVSEVLAFNKALSSLQHFEYEDELILTKNHKLCKLFSVKENGPQGCLFGL